MVINLLMILSPPSAPANSALHPLLKAAPYGSDALSVETQPVHPSHVAGVFNLDAPIHDDREPTFFPDTRAVLIDYTELTPHILRPDCHGFFSDSGECVRCAKDVNDVNLFPHVAKVLVTLLPKDRGLARIDWYDAVAVAHKVEPDEVARAQLIF